MGWSEWKTFGGGAVLVGSGAGTYDIAALRTDYSNLTVDNFIVTSKSKASAQSAKAASKVETNTIAPIVTYNNSTGTLTVSNNSHYVGSNSSSVGCVVNVVADKIYLIDSVE